MLYQNREHRREGFPIQDELAHAQRLITVKFLAVGIDLKDNQKRWSRQLPGHKCQWGSCRFIFDINATAYDWLVVYHDLPRGSASMGTEKLHCPREKTILITAEPSSITVYGSDYLRQYGLIITSQEPWAIKHPNILFTQPGLPWYYWTPSLLGMLLWPPIYVALRSLRRSFSVN